MANGTAGSRGTDFEWPGRTNPYANANSAPGVRCDSKCDAPGATWMGMPGCTQYVSIEATHFMLSVTGATTWAIPIPAQPWLVGSTFFVQALVPDAAANAFGATVTNAGAATIGG